MMLDFISRSVLSWWAVVYDFFFFLLSVTVRLFHWLCSSRVRCRRTRTLQFSRFGSLSSSSRFPALTNSMETGYVEAYARIDGAFVCRWRFEASLCNFFSRQGEKKADLQHMTWCNIVTAYNIYICAITGDLSYATRTLAVVFKNSA